MSINLGNVPSYLLTPHTIAAIQLLQSNLLQVHPYHLIIIQFGSKPH